VSTRWQWPGRSRSLSCAMRCLPCCRMPA